MSTAIGTVIYPVKDLAQAKSILTAILGTQPDFDQPYYVGYRVGGQDIGLDPNGHARGWTGAVAFWHVENLAETAKRLLDAGAETVEEAHDVGGGKLVAAFRDVDGNMIGLVQEP
jgi:predicted enzyme related to lactoylglutathione lyase